MWSLTTDIFFFLSTHEYLSLYIYIYPSIYPTAYCKHCACVHTHTIIMAIWKTKMYISPPCLYISPALLNRRHYVSTYRNIEYK